MRKLILPLLFLVAFTMLVAIDAAPAATSYTLKIQSSNVFSGALTSIVGPMGAVTLPLPITLVDANDNVNDLIGTYTANAAPVGFKWAANPILVLASNFNSANYANITFVLIQDAAVIQEIAPALAPPGYPVAMGLEIKTAYTAKWDGIHELNIPQYDFVNHTEAWIRLGGVWYLATGPNWTWPSVDYDGEAYKTAYVVILGPIEDTLPVELSSFTAVLTAQNFVKLTWITESETNMNGYNVYRNETADYAAATHVGYQASTNSSTQHVYNHTDNEVEINSTYYYWLECVDFNGSSTLYGPQFVTVHGTEAPNAPTATTLGNAYPNPFKTNTNIVVDVKGNENATVTIYNILGQAVKTYNLSAGNHNLKWNGKDSNNNACGSGIYFYKLSSPTMNQTKKMIIVK